MNTKESTKKNEELIRRIYLEILKREPDSDGLKYYLTKVNDNEIDKQKLINLLKSSQEYIEKTKKRIWLSTLLGTFRRKTSRFDYRNYPKKINLGCGFDRKEGYLNIDFQSFHNPDLVTDVRNLSVLPSDYYIEILAQDVLEHIPRDQTNLTLMEWHRLLKKGGILKLRVPNIIGLLELFKDKEKETIEKQEELIQCLFGTQAYTGDFHYTAFTNMLITHYLTIVSFGEITITSKDHWMIEVVCVKRSNKQTQNYVA